MDWRTSLSLAQRFVVLFLFVTANGHAATFALEAGSVLLYEDEGRAAFNVTNTGDDPILVISKVKNLKEDDIADRLLVTPPITRIEPRQSQLIHYVLREGEALQEEHMLEASFEAIPVKKQSAATINIKQIIPLMIYPKSIATTDEPWRDLTVRHEDGRLEIRNTGKHVVRLLPSLQTQPQAADIPLKLPYLMPGEVTSHRLSDKPERIRITPMNRRGSVLTPITITVKNIGSD
ncbi:fimbria/pilus chaperone family protein [Dyella sp. GSA-30]|uniref:fimbria/pilus chaperone family protein n=1 Tax=Dyella sp. GSA-30 TaxID=2994496 RepID=UPI002490BE6F|nr:fimbria/pilus chaperone family protein [Dyella sp. GSA-30]BDU20374.1 periplasmic chaperone protein [Dyella sp. GSA-30]